MRWQDVEIVPCAARQPLVVLHGAVAETARRQGVRAVQISLSHAGEYALACAVTEPVATRGSEDG